MTNKQKILKISKELGLTHIGSNLSVLPILEGIYENKNVDDIVILDNAHAHLAHLVVEDSYLKKRNGFILLANIQTNPKQLIEIFGIHCDRKAGCDASGGSLGHGLGIGIGYALANPYKTIYVIVSDGSMMEGSNWEALRIASDLFLNNLKIYCNFNGYTAVAKRSAFHLFKKLWQYTPTLHIEPYFTENGKGFDGVQGHYKKL